MILQKNIKNRMQINRFQDKPKAINELKSKNIYIYVYRHIHQSFNYQMPEEFTNRINYFDDCNILFQSEYKWTKSNKRKKKKYFILLHTV